MLGAGRNCRLQVGDQFVDIEHSPPGDEVQKWHCPHLTTKWGQFNHRSKTGFPNQLHVGKAIASRGTLPRLGATVAHPHYHERPCYSNGKLRPAGVPHARRFQTHCDSVSRNLHQTYRTDTMQARRWQEARAHPDLDRLHAIAGRRPVMSQQFQAVFPTHGLNVSVARIQGQAHAVITE